MRIYKKYKKINLINGGVLYYTKNTISKTTKVSLAFDCGSRVEKIPGLAHFTEHMFFAGTDELRTKQEVADKYFKFIGANAFTNIYKINFAGNIFTEELEDYVKLVSHLITHSTFNKKAVESEIKVVQQEIANSIDNNRQMVGYIDDYNVFKHETFKNTILGSAKSVATIKSKDVKDYVKKYFVANNLDAFVVSPLSLKKVKKIIENNLSNNLPVNENFERLDYNFLDIKDNNFYSITTKKIGKAYVYIHFSLNKTMNDRKYINKFFLVMDMMNDFSHGMNKELRLDKNLVYGSSISFSAFKNSGYLTFKTECDNENVNQVITALSNYIKKVLTNGFSQEELTNVKRYFRFTDKNNEPRTNNLNNKLFFYKRHGYIERYKDIKKLCLSTTLDECNRMFKEVFTSPKVSLTLVSDLDKKSVMTKKEFNKLFDNTNID